MVGWPNRNEKTSEALKPTTSSGCCKCKSKYKATSAVNRTSFRNRKMTSFGTYGLFLVALSCSIFCCCLSLSTWERKANEPQAWKCKLRVSCSLLVVFPCYHWVWWYQSCPQRETHRKKCTCHGLELHPGTGEPTDPCSGVSHRLKPHYKCLTKVSGTFAR